jgi:hypothetical protein
MRFKMEAKRGTTIIKMASTARMPAPTRMEG